MKRTILALFLLGFFSTSFAQILNPVKLSYTAKKKSATQYEITVKAMIEPKWHLYSTTNPEGGAEPTTLKFEGVKPVGSIREVGKLHSIFDETFSVPQKYFENNVNFVQVVTVRPGTKKVTGSIEYMVCNDRKCLPPKEVGFEVSL